MKSTETLTPQQAKAKIEHYCAYQERCHTEVKNKLFEYGLHSSEVDELLVYLIQAGFLNEERFAKAFAGGKFRTKHWGKNKIRQELKLRKISDYCIRKGMAEIPDDDYMDTLRKLAEKKQSQLRSGNPLMNRQKLIRYLISKGYETDLIMDTIRQD